MRHSLAELEGLITAKREQFTRDELGQSYGHYDMTLSPFSYPALVPEGGPVVGEEAAYVIFQRLSLGVEVVVADLEHHGTCTRHTKQLWTKVQRRIHDLLVKLYTRLVASGVEATNTLLTREVIPASLTCVTNPVGQDMRDFVILRHVFQVAAFYSQNLS